MPTFPQGKPPHIRARFDNPMAPLLDVMKPLGLTLVSGYVSAVNATSIDFDVHGVTIPNVPVIGPLPEVGDQLWALRHGTTILPISVPAPYVPGPTDYELIAEAEADGTSELLNVLSIPQTHRHLLILMTGYSEASTLDWNIRFESGGSNTNHRYVRNRMNLSGAANTVTGSGATSRVPVGQVRVNPGTAGVRVWVYDYTEPAITSFEFSGTSSTSAANVYAWTGGGYWLDSSNPVTDIYTDIANTDDLGVGSKIEVYGIGVLP